MRSWTQGVTVRMWQFKQGLMHPKEGKSKKYIDIISGDEKGTVRNPSKGLSLGIGIILKYCQN